MPMPPSFCSRALPALLFAALLSCLSISPAAHAEPSPAKGEELPRLTLFATASSFYLLSRASVSADFRLASFANDWVHVTASAGLGGVSFSLGPVNFDAEASAGVLFFPGAHHLELRAGTLYVTNSVAGDGPYLYPLFEVGYRYAHARSPLALGLSLSTTGPKVFVGVAF